MTSRRRSRPSGLLLGSAVLLCALALFHGWSFKSFPNLNADEAMESNHAYNILAGRGNIYSLYEDIFPPGFETMLYSLPNVIRPVYNYALAGAFWVAGVSPWTGRGFSLLCAMASLALVAWMVWRWTGSGWAVLGFAAFLGFHSVFTLSAHEARPEAMLGLFAVLSFFLLDRAEESPWCAALAGLTAALAPAIHTNGGAVALASLAVLVLRARHRWLYFGLGVVCGTTALMFLVRPDLFLPGWVVFEGFFGYRPPVHSWGWNLAAEFGQELRRYLGPRLLSHEPVAPSLHWALRLEWSAVFGAWLASWWIHRDRRMRALLLWVGTTILFYSLFVANKNLNYVAAFEPLTVLLLVVFIHRAVSTAGARWPLGRLLLPGVAGAVLLGLAAPFFLVPMLFLLFILPGRVSGKTNSRNIYLFILLALLPVFCLRLYGGDVMISSLEGGWALLRSWRGLCAVLAGAGAITIFRRGRNSGSPVLPATVWLGVSLAMVMIFSASVHAFGVVARAREAVPFDLAAARLRAHVPEGSRVLGPQLLWWAFPGDDYRDWNALSYCRWLTGREDMTPFVAAWRPDYLIVDDSFKHIFLRRRPLSDVIRVPLTKVGSVRRKSGEGLGEYREGESIFQSVDIFRFDWQDEIPAKR